MKARVSPNAMELKQRKQISIELARKGKDDERKLNQQVAFKKFAAEIIHN